MRAWRRAIVVYYPTDAVGNVNVSMFVPVFRAALLAVLAIGSLAASEALIQASKN